MRKFWFAALAACAIVISCGFTVRSKSYVVLNDPYESQYGNDKVLAYWIKKVPFGEREVYELTAIGNQWHYYKDGKWRALSRGVGPGIDLFVQDSDLKGARWETHRQH